MQDLGAQIAGLLCQRHGLRIQIDKNKSAKPFNPNPVRANVARGELFQIVGLRRASQTAGQIMG